MRSRPPAPLSSSVLCSVLLALAGCSADQPVSADPGPAVPAARPPAAAAGGACILLDFGLIAEKLGVTFDVAAADQAQDASTCVVQREGASRPDLMLSVVERTSADGPMFLAELKPAKAAAVPGLGAAGYRLLTGGSGAAGPVVEVGWLTKNAQLKTLRFTFEAGAPTDRADQLAPRLVELAKALDSTAEPAG